jgi:hypothetical protein
MTYWFETGSLIGFPFLRLIISPFICFIEEQDESFINYENFFR